MMFQYPDHFKYPEDERIFFLDHIPLWEDVLSPLKNRPNVCLEIGALYGGSSVYILEEFCKMEGSHHYIMDINSNEYIENNIYPYGDKVTYLKGESADYFKRLEHLDKTKEFLDFVYIDGNHMSKYVLEDAVNSFYSLKNYGVMVFDDYNGGLEQPLHMQAKTGIDSFIKCYSKYLNIVDVGYQLIVQKIPYVNELELRENYYNKSE